jgi:hypothetical protein
MKTSPRHRPGLGPWKSPLILGLLILASCHRSGGADTTDATAADAALADARPDVAVADAALDAGTPADAAPPDAALADASMADGAPPDASPPLAADFTLIDINPASPTFGQPRSVSGVLGKVLLIHFPSFG